MTPGKIEVSVAGIGFSGEEGKDWLGGQLDKILSTAAEISKQRPEVLRPSDSRGAGSNDVPIASPPVAQVGLGTQIKAQSGETSQVKRFLATADWLRARGDTAFTTAKVTKALAQNHQKRLGNRAGCLAQNFPKGLCEKQGEGSFITPDALKDLGYSA